VVINYTNNTIPIKLNVNDLDASTNLKVYITDGVPGNNLAKIGEFNINDIYNSPPRSVVTFTNQP
jgi:hypothetical protein